MTPTPEQLAAVLPRCSAGLDGGDWTDPDERLAWARRVVPYVEEASRLNTEEDVQASIEWLRSLRMRPLPSPPSWAIPTQPSPPAPGITYHAPKEAQ